ncbi:MAG: hypothetical protein JWN48_1512 [Myxococcaceae bacterium]|nr:hypothetical protein [Myxococcaceae bacterium]
MRIVAGLALLLSCLLTVLCASEAQAESYEWQRMERVLRDNKLELVGLPEGKRIAFIRVVSDDVFVKDEVWPLFLNWFHMTTREAVVRRELLFQKGGAYEEARIEESMRNLRGMAIFALVRIVAVKTEDPDAVGVVVHTRDLWSLRLETAFATSTIVDQATVRLTERNFLGRNKAPSVEFDYLPRNFSLSQSYVARRVWGSTVQLGESAGIVFNNKTRHAEGSVWGLTVGEPFYNLKQRFSWTAKFNYLDSVVRNLKQRQYVTFVDPENGADGPHANRVYRRKRGTGSVLGYLRFGEYYKQSWGFGLDYRSLKAKANRETMLVPQLEEYFDQHILPRQRTEVGPTLSYDILMPEFARFQNLGTYGQTENVRIGPSASLAARAPLKAFGSNTNSWVFSSSVGCVLAPAGFLIEANLYGQTRYENLRLVDQRLDVLLRGATPVLFRALRLVARATWTARRHDTTNSFVALGAADGLRGYTSNQIYSITPGASSVLANFEIRTLPIEWQAVHVGGVLFYDAGTIYNAASELRMHYAVGLGLRVLIPQLNRTPFSLDAAARFDPPFRIVPTIKDGQVVPLTAAEDPVN